VEIWEKVADIVALVFRSDPALIKKMDGEAPLSAIGLDSLNCMEIVVNIEEEFSIAFHDEELLLDRLNTINKLCAIVEQKLQHVTAG
jgi:acyl carrier protein